MGNQPSTWLMYAREKTTGYWCAQPIWGFVHSECYTDDSIRAKFRHEVYRFAGGSNARFQAIYLYRDQSRRIKCCMESPDRLVLSFYDGDTKQSWCGSTDESNPTEGATPPLEHKFNQYWVRDRANETLTTMRWTKQPSLP